MPACSLPEHCASGLSDVKSEFFFLPDQRDLKNKCCSLSNRAFYFDPAVMCIHHRLYVTQAEAKSFYIVHITCVRPIEFFKNPALCFLGHTDAVVFQADDHVFSGPLGLNPDR